MCGLELLLGALDARRSRLVGGHELDDDHKQLRVGLLVLERVSERVRSG